MLKKGKKSPVVKILLIVATLSVLLGVILFLKVPLYMAEDHFSNEGHFYMSCNYENWETQNTEKSNYENEIAKLYVDEKYGEYTVETYQSNVVLNFKDDKKISILNTPVKKEKIPSFEDELNKCFLSAEYPILIPVIKKGLENMGVDTSMAPGYDMNIYYTLITRETPWVEFFCSLDEYYDMCAYYGLFLTHMPSGGEDSYYIISESEDVIGWGWSNIGEDSNAYIMNFQTKGEYGENIIIQVSGFTKEEAQEIFKYAVIK